MANTTATGAVIYVDGSANPNPGFFGSGLHGYTYIKVDEKNKPTKTGSWNLTDRGYCLDKDMKTSDANAISATNYLDSFSAGTGTGTNNLAEINAVSLFFEHYAELAEEIEELTVIADSQYVLNGISQWVSGWIKNNWVSSTGSPVSNREAWERLYTYVTAFEAKGKKITYLWVKGHNDEFGNVKADYLAGLGTRHSAASIEKAHRQVSPVIGYHKVDIKLHPLLGLKRVYFNTDPEFNSPGVYYQTGWSGTDFIIGKRTPEAVFSVVVLEKPDPVMESVIAAQYASYPSFNTIVYAKTDRIRSPDVYPYLETYGQYCLTKDRRNLNLNFLDTKPVVFEVRPGELPLRAIEVLNHLEDLLTRFLSQYVCEGKLDKGGYQYTVHDVSSHFFTETQKRDKLTHLLNKDFGVGVSKTSVQVTEEINGKSQVLELPLVFQDDIPGRNTLKKLEADMPKVFIITWRESDRLLKYSTVIQTTGATGIWSNHFANQILISAGQPNA